MAAPLHPDTCYCNACVEKAALKAAQVESWDELDLAEPCPLCGGQLQVLGQLAQRVHLHCRDCGMQTSSLKETPSPSS